MALGNLPAPEEHIVFELATIRRNYLKEALEDNELDAGERAGLAQIDRLIDFTTEVKARRHLASHIEKGGNPTDYMNRIAAPIGMKVVSLAAEREARKIVPFPGTDEYA